MATYRKRNSLSNVQHKAISLLLIKDVHEMNYAAVAEEIGVSTRTLLRWRNTGDFAAELLMQAEQLQRAFLVDTYAELRRLIASSDTTDSNKLKAIEIMLKNQGRLKSVKESSITVDDSRTLEELLFEIQDA